MASIVELTKQDWQHLSFPIPRSGAFLQTVDWGDFQEGLGRKVLRFGYVQEGQITAAVQAVVTDFPGRTHYLYVPRGPVGDQSAAPDFFRMIRDQTGCLFIRFEPTASVEDARIRKVQDRSPACTLLTRIEQREDCSFVTEIHPKCRYNVRVAERRGVQIHLNEPMSDEVWRLFEKTGVRSDIRMHPRPYYEAQLKSLQGLVKAFLAVACLDGHAVACALIIDHGKTRTYLHGASDREFRPAMAPHLLHIRLMLDACEKGMHWYDWWGIAPPEAGPDHPWAGVTTFKRQFGGEVLRFPGTYDWIGKPMLYRGYEMAKRFLH